MTILFETSNKTFIKVMQCTLYSSVVHFSNSPYFKQEYRVNGSTEMVINKFLFTSSKSLLSVVAEEKWNIGLTSEIR